MFKKYLAYFTCKELKSFLFLSNIKLTSKKIDKSGLIELVSKYLEGQIKLTTGKLTRNEDNKRIEIKSFETKAISQKNINQEDWHEYNYLLIWEVINNVIIHAQNKCAKRGLKSTNIQKPVYAENSNTCSHNFVQLHPGGCCIRKSALVHIWNCKTFNENCDQQVFLGTHERDIYEKIVTSAVIDSNDIKSRSDFKLTEFFQLGVLKHFHQQIQSLWDVLNLDEIDIFASCEQYDKELQDGISELRKELKSGRETMQTEGLIRRLFDNLSKNGNSLKDSLITSIPSVVSLLKLVLKFLARMGVTLINGLKKAYTKGSATTDNILKYILGSQYKTDMGNIVEKIKSSSISITKIIAYYLTTHPIMVRVFMHMAKLTRNKICQYIGKQIGDSEVLADLVIQMMQKNREQLVNPVGDPTDIFDPEKTYTNNSKETIYEYILKLSESSSESVIHSFVDLVTDPAIIWNIVSNNHVITQVITLTGSLITTGLFSICGTFASGLGLSVSLISGGIGAVFFNYLQETSKILISIMTDTLTTSIEMHSTQAALISTIIETFNDVVNIVNIKNCITNVALGYKLSRYAEINHMLQQKRNFSFYQKHKNLLREKYNITPSMKPKDNMVQQLGLELKAKHQKEIVEPVSIKVPSSIGINNTPIPKMKYESEHLPAVVFDVLPDNIPVPGITRIDKIPLVQENPLSRGSVKYSTSTNNNYQLPDLPDDDSLDSDSDY